MLRKTLTFGCSLLLSFGMSLSAQSVDELISKNIQARGGLEKLRAVQSVRLSGHMSMGGGLEAPFSIQMKRPGMMRFEATIQGKTMVQGFDGETGWQIMPFMGSNDPEKVPEEEVKQLKEEADWDGPLVDYKEKGHTVELAGKEDVEGTEALKLKVTLKSGDVKYFYLDPENYLVLKETAKVNREGAEIDMESYLGNYKQVDGLMVPFSVDSRAKGQQGGSTMTLDKIEFGVALDEAIFKMPAPAIPAAK